MKATRSASLLVTLFLAMTLKTSADDKAAKPGGKKFSVIEVVQTGGFAGVNMQYRIQSDGQFTMKSRRRSAKGKLNSKDLAILTTAVNEADWAKVPKTLKAKNAVDDFNYTMHVVIGRKPYRVDCGGILAAKRSPLREIVFTLVKIQRTSIKKK
jgi:hypothetical protein